MPVFLGERYIPDANQQFALEQSDRLRAAVSNATDVDVGLLSTTFVPNEEWAFDLFEGASAADVEHFYANAEVAFERVTEAVHLDNPKNDAFDSVAKPGNGVANVNKRIALGIGAVLLVGLLALGVVYSLGLSNSGLASSYRAAEESFPMTFRGEYRYETAYTAGDVVSFGGSTYVSEGEASWEPPEVPWRLLVAAGPVGPAGPQGDRGPIGAQGPKGDKGDTGTAASWISVESQPSVILNGTLGWASARCPSSAYVAVGGGWLQLQDSGFQSTNNVVLIGNPAGRVTHTYEVWLKNLGPGDAKIKVFAICAL